jgi:septum formation protein
MVPFVLASASPARLATLRSAGLDPQVIVSGVAEDDVTGTPDQVAASLARRKAEAVAARLTGPANAEGLVLGCDSVLDLDGVALGKPRDADDAISRWADMAGRSGILRTGHWLIDLASRRAAGEVSATSVHFAAPTDEELAAYLATGEPLAVAGAFTLDGRGGWFVDAIEGDPGTVIGVSLPALRRLLLAVGRSLTDVWPSPPGTDHPRFPHL